MRGLYDPADATPGKLYKISVREHDSSSKEEEIPSYFVFDPKGKVVKDRRWPLTDGAVGLVLKVGKEYTTIMIGDDIIHIADDEPRLTISLVPITE